jgi:hypothetical protein
MLVKVHEGHHVDVCRAVLRRIAITVGLYGGTVVAQAPRVRDSAGVQIVENRARTGATVMFRLGPKSIDVGGPADNLDDELNPLQLAGIGALRLSSGALTVTNTIRLQFYDAHGRKTGDVGRLGSGPSEFRSLGVTQLCQTRGDTIVAGDARNGRFAVVYEQRVIRTTPYTAQFGGDLIGCFDDGTVLMMGGLPNMNLPTYSIRLNRVRLNGTLVANLGSHEFQSPHAFNYFTYATIRVWGQGVYLGDGSKSEIRVYSANGRLIRLIRSADVLHRFTPEEEAQATSIWPNRTRKHWRPSTQPSYATFVIDSDGRLWVKDFVPRNKWGDTEGWTAFDKYGKLIGRLLLPRRIDGKVAHVLSFGSNEVQLLRVDAVGFAHLALYPIIQTGSARERSD